MQPTPTPATSDFEHSESRSSIDLLDVFWRRRYGVIGCTLIGIVLGVLYCFLATPMYESYAKVLVVQKRPQAVTGDNQYESGFEDYLATHLAVIAHPMIVERAIESADLGSLSCFSEVVDPEEYLADAVIEELSVEGGSRELGESADSIMSLAFRSSVPEESPIVLQALLDSYEAFHHEVYRGMFDNTLGLIEDAKDLLQKDLTAQEKSYSTFRQNSPLIASGTEEVNPLQDRLSSIEEQRSELLLRRAEVKRQLLALEQAKKDGSDFQQLLSMVSELRQLETTTNGLPNVSTALESQLIQLIDDEKRLLEHYGPNHPHVAMMRERIAASRRFFALPTTAHMQDSKPGEAVESSSANADSVAVYNQYLEQELKRLEISEKLLGDLYDREHNAAKELSSFQLTDESLRRNIERTEALYDVVINRLQEASLIKDFGGFETRVIAPPRTGWKVSPRMEIILPVATFAGLLLGCMLAIVFELRDDSFQSCEQIQQQLGLPVVGQIPQFAAAPRSARRLSASDTLHPMLGSYYQPRSLPAESFRALRTALFKGPDETCRVIQVTGVGPQDGASTVVSNLAVSLAQTGKRVLLIDADLRRPRQDRLFGIARPQSGLAEIVASDVEPLEVISKTSVDNLWLLAAGPLPAAGPCELFTSPRFGDLINLLRESYDHVLIDTEPLSVASDPCVIASHTDGVVLTLRIDQDSRQRALRAKELLVQLDIRVLGMVVNRMRGAILKQRQIDGREYAVRKKDRNVSARPRSQPAATTMNQTVE